MVLCRPALGDGNIKWCQLKQVVGSILDNEQMTCYDHSQSHISGIGAGQLLMILQDCRYFANLWFCLDRRHKVETPTAQDAPRTLICGFVKRAMAMGSAIASDMDQYCWQPITNSRSAVRRLLRYNQNAVVIIM